MDGMSITTGDPGRVHIWTYAVGLNRDWGFQSCPCEGGTEPPAFVGGHFFCDTGNEGDWDPVWYVDEPLWDADATTGGCQPAPEPGAFSRDFDQPMTDPIEVRLMIDQMDENVAVTRLELYVR